MQKTIYSIFLVTLFIFSCKKDINSPIFPTHQASNPDDVKTITRSGISYAEVNAWFAKNPAGRYLVPDWSKAQHTLIGNVAVVKMPIQLIGTNDQLKINSNEQAAGLKTMATATFNAARPVMLYLFKDKKAKTDTIRPILLNFVPDNIVAENGENNIWTGKLFEWDLQSDIIPYQVLKKSYVSTKSAISLSETLSTSNSKNSSNLQVNNLIRIIWDSLKWFVETIGHALGVPGDYGNFSDIYGWCDFLGGIFCGGGGSSSGGGGGGSSYSIIYSSFIPGYEGYDTVNSGWSQYPDGDPCLGLSSTTNLKVNQEEGGCPVTLGPVNAFADYYELLANQKAWLKQHVEVYSTLNIYIDGEGLSFEDAQDFVNFSVVYLMGHPNVPLSRFINQFATPNEGKDGENDYEENYWNNPNLNIQPQALPSFQNFSDNYPRLPADKVYELIGGVI
ncbi:hypothetical protein [Mucilaginibacter auburnensis]|uniref:hypothetical protein n=1 Tax=Mucilaginibacter auburnensis TaxID=1457233 RepID=UPI000C23F860|nr:hypothetical protein [Mucilaginibacter auburnensis]